MKKYMMCIASYSDYRKDFYQNFTKPNNLDYCLKHNIEYIDFTENIEPIRGNYVWVKPYILDDLLNNKFKDGDLIICIDADIAIANHKIEFTLNDGKSYGYAIDSANTHNMGFYIVRNNSWSRNMIKLMIDDERYEHYIDKETVHERFKTKSSFWRGYNEQASWYSMAGIKRHSDISFWDLENYGWNSDCDDWTVYDVNELKDNVQLFDSKYNATELGFETHGTFNINKVKYFEVINRHFAGSQDWNSSWLNTNKFKLTLYFFNPVRVVKFLIDKYGPRLAGKIRKIVSN